MSRPSIFDVRDGDRIRPVYEVPGTGLLVRIADDWGVLVPLQVLDASGRYQAKRTRALKDVFSAYERRAATMHAIGSWLRGNA